MLAITTFHSNAAPPDKPSRVASASGGWGTITYGYDGAGNMANQTSGGTTTTYTIGSYNRLTGISGPYRATVTYNSNGDLTKLVNGSNTWKYYYDFENRLTGVSKNGVNVQNNTFSGDGMRLSKTESGTTTVFVYQGLNIIYEKNLGTGTITKHFYAYNIQVGKLVSSTQYFYLQDLLGSTRYVTTSSGSTVFSSNYRPFGSQYGSSGTENFMYTGKYFDSSTPAIQRFVSEDSYTGNNNNNNNPQSLNRYSYVGNNPESMIDPTGHMGVHHMVICR
jgi:RHS repeat-associated protein